MKKIILGCFLGISLIGLVAFSTIQYEIKNHTAEVEQVQGVYIFVSSKPVKEFDYLGTVKAAGIVMSKDYEDLMPKMVKKAIKDYPKADAVIFKGGSIYECDAIKFK
jgi:predicted small secreted protein